jgi:hypothetical protein
MACHDGNAVVATSFGTVAPAGTEFIAAPLATAAVSMYRPTKSASPYPKTPVMPTRTSSPPDKGLDKA